MFHHGTNLASDGRTSQFTCDRGKCFHVVRHLVSCRESSNNVGTGVAVRKPKGGSRVPVES